MLVTAELFNAATTSSAVTMWPVNTSTPGQRSQNPQMTMADAQALLMQERERCTQGTFPTA